MRLYKVSTVYGHEYFYWAENEEDAKQMFIEQGCPKNVEIQVDRVWANNDDSRYRGYITQL